MVNFRRLYRRLYRNAQKIEWRYFLPLIFFVVGVTLIIYFRQVSTVNRYIRVYVVEPPLGPILFLIPIIISSFYYHSDTPRSEESELILLSGLDDFLDIVLSGMTYGYALSVSYLFLTKFFMQNVFDKTFFVGFETKDLWLISFLLGYAFYWSAKNVYIMLRETIFSGEVGQVVTKDE